MNSEFGYGFGDLAGDYVRAIIGIILCVSPFIYVKPAAVMAVVLLLIGALFLMSLVETLARHVTKIVVDDDGIGFVAMFERRISWQSLEEYSLSHYSTWRGGGGNGWMQLKLKGNGRTLRIVSKLEGFAEIVKTSLSEAIQKDIPLSSFTMENLSALGIADPRERVSL
ncbi:MAG: hypothetical protein HQ503_05840 [Rhodospirillales bacterium]|nr:hypothetical protein [Rhodospirillales bacterium]